MKNSIETSPSSSNGLEGIQAIALDVDGVLTDGGVWWGPNGEEWKRFCFADIMGVSLARRAGLTLALISGEDSPLVDRYATKMHIAHVFKGCRDKAAALRNFASAAGIPLSLICFMGDDINDLPAMQIAGFSAAPANASNDVRSLVNFISTQGGGNGAVRELVDTILAARGLRAADVFSITPATHLTK
jgi:3-deoxy-D-manno-octulosonate 8-phosphate phosphatase (KDO 8-P phosphatase)